MNVLPGGQGRTDQAFVETPDGLLLTSRRAEIERDLARVDAELSEHGLSLDELVESGREIRGELIKERYGLDG